jgi:hypothetical protein
MDTGRATRAISLVLISSVVVFAGWGAGDFLQGTTGTGQTGGYSAGGYRGASHFFWYRSGGYYYGGGGARPGGGVGGPGGAPSGLRGGAAAPSVRGGFGSFGHSAGA